MSSKLTTEIALTALCVWEHLLELRMKRDKSGTRYDQLFEHGQVAARSVALEEIAPAVETAYAEVSEEYDLPFDWEFVPAFITLAESHVCADHVASFIISDEEAKAIGNKIVELQQSGKPTEAEKLHAVFDEDAQEYVETDLSLDAAETLLCKLQNGGGDCYLMESPEKQELSRDTARDLAKELLLKSNADIYVEVKENSGNETDEELYKALGEHHAAISKVHSILESHAKGTLILG